MSEEIPNGLGSAKHDYFAAGGHAWNDLTNVITFKRSGSEVADFVHDAPGVCSQRDSALHYESLNDNAVQGSIVMCYDFFRTKNSSFQVALNSDLTWYWAVSPPIQSGQWDIKGVSTHEFGHAAGGWLPDSENGHFDQTDDPGLCGSNVAIGSLHTMCTGPPLLRFKGNLHEQDLELHDSHTFESRYP